MLAKIRQLPPERKAEVSQIVDSMVDDVEAKRRHNTAFTNAITELSEESFHRIWDNPKDAEYDDL
jgi:hypothetical protein